MVSTPVAATALSLLRRRIVLRFRAHLVVHMVVECWVVVARLERCRLLRREWLDIA